MRWFLHPLRIFVQKLFTTFETKCLNTSLWCQRSRGPRKLSTNWSSLVWISHALCSHLKVWLGDDENVYAFIYIYIHARVSVHAHSCRRILFICTVQSCCYMHVYHRCFLRPTCVGVGVLEVELFPACSWLALVAGVGGYVLVAVEIGVLSCIFLYFCGY